MAIHSFRWIGRRAESGDPDPALPRSNHPGHHQEVDNGEKAPPDSTVVDPKKRRIFGKRISRHEVIEQSVRHPATVHPMDVFKGGRSIPIPKDEKMGDRELLEMHSSWYPPNRKNHFKG